MRGTAFQERVWQALRTIPSGPDGVSYAEIAASIGAPQRSGRWRRRVRRQSRGGRHPLPPRGRTDGALGGYRWGVARKEALLAREAA